MMKKHKPMMPLPEWWEMGIFYMIGVLATVAMFWVIVGEPPVFNFRHWMILLMVNIIHFLVCRPWIWVCYRIISLKFVRNILTAGQDAKWWLRLIYWPIAELQLLGIVFIALLGAVAGMLVSHPLLPLFYTMGEGNRLDLYILMMGPIGSVLCCGFSIRYNLLEKDSNQLGEVRSRKVPIKPWKPRR